MYNAAIINQQYYGIQEVEEKVSLTLQGYFNLRNFTDNGVPINEDFSIRIVRNLVDDSFNTTLFHPELRNSGNYNKIFTISNLNNDFIVNSAYGGQYPNVSGRDLVHHSLFQSTPFSKASLLSFDFMYSSNQGYGTNSAILSSARSLFNFTITPRKTASSNFYYLKSNTALMFKSLKQIDIHFDHNEVVGNKPLTEQDSNVFVVKKQYNCILVLPIQFNRTTPIKDVVQMYSFNESGDPITFDTNITKPSYKSTTFVGGLDVDYNSLNILSSPLNALLQASDGQVIRQKVFDLGTIQVREAISYDYDKQRFEVGSASDYFIGDHVAFNLSGDFNQEISLGINSIFAKQKISISNHFNQKYLDEFDGQIVLKIVEKTTSSKIFNALKWVLLTIENIKVIRDENKNKSFVTLNGLLNFEKNISKV